jgi:hypothetical protein
MAHATFEQLINISEEFSTKVGRLSYFTKHGPEIGRSHEIILSNFLREYLPKSISVSTGFIYHPTLGTSPQIDILIWNSNDYAPLFTDGGLVVIRPDSAIVAIEVKTSLNKKEIISSIQNMNSVVEMSIKNKKLIWTCLFAYNGNVNNIIQHMLQMQGINNPNTPQQIIVLNKFNLDYKHSIHGHKILMKEGNNNFLKAEAFAYFYASLINWIGREFDQPHKKRASAEQLEELFEFKGKYWSKQTIKVGGKNIIEDE